VTKSTVFISRQIQSANASKRRGRGEAKVAKNCLGMSRWEALPIASRTRQKTVGFAASSSPN